MRGRTEKGFALVLTSLMMLFIVSLMGMALDAGLLFAVRGRLSSAADSAALAAVRSVHLGANVADANAKARQTAERFLKANFPDDYLGIDPARTRLSADFKLSTQGNKPTGLLKISIRAEVAAPVYFMKLWGVPAVPVAVEGKATRRNLVVVMVLDKSASMGSRTTALGDLPSTLRADASPCEALVFAAGQTIDSFSPYDTIGLVSFDETASTDFPASANFKGAGPGSLRDKLSRINCGITGTNTTAALQAAYEEIQRVDQNEAVNAVMLFTDGIPNGVNAEFPLRTSIDNRWGPADVPDAHPGASDCQSADRQCIQMPVVCPAGSRIGAIAQAADFSLASGPRTGLSRAFPDDSVPPFPSGCPNSGSKMTSQSLAYIPETDRFGNSTHGPKDDWAFQVNRQCLPPDVEVTPGNSRCKKIGGDWSGFAGEWAGRSPGTNFFQAGPYAGRFRTDHANAIGAVSLNTAINQAARMRSDPNYHVRIDSLYLEGNGTDPVDREFLPMVCNLGSIPPLPYQGPETPARPNPLHVTSQPEGHYWQTVNARELGSHFARLTAALLRLTQ